jgi:GDP-L-fucose synthase
MMQEVVGYKGKLVFDTTKPDGMPRKLLDISKLTALGWSPKIPLVEGLQKTYAWFLKNGASRL